MKRKTSSKLRVIPPLILFVGFILFFGIHLYSATFTVDTTTDTTDANPGDGIAEDSFGNCSLRAAIMEANALTGTDTIEIPAGTYTLTISGSGEDYCKKGDLDIRSNLNIQGGGKTLTIINGNDLDRIFHILGNKEVSITDMTIRNGKTPQGKNATAGPGSPGGGVLNDQGTLTITRCKISENLTGKGGYNATDGGGHGGAGGGLCNYKGKVEIYDSDINRNRTGDGGSDASGWGGDGAGIYNNEGTLTLNTCTIRDNRNGTGGWQSGHGGDGGGIGNYKGVLTVEYCDILNNRCGDGGGYDAGGGGDGGGIDNWPGTMIIKYSTIRSNNAGDGIIDGTGGSGGGICTGGLDSSVRIYHSLIADNRSGYNEESDCGFGGGIYNMGTLSIFNSTISRNSTQPNVTSGGGIANFDTLILESCTITGNTADDRGGGICNGYPFYPQDEKIKIHNTLIANNNAGSAVDCSGIITSRGYNLIRIPAGCTITGDTTGNIYWANPILGPLTNNGGPTETYALLPTSPCLDTGDPGDYEETDQRGVFRPKDGDGDSIPLPDIGAYEKFAPLIIIVKPLHLAEVWGIVEIEATANTKNVDFFVDNSKIHGDDSEPFTCEWNTASYANGSHVIKAKGYDTSDGLTAWDQVKVFVDNTVISLTAERLIERAWIIRRQYGKITFTITHTGASKPAKYVIERQDGSGPCTSIAEIPASEVQGNSYTYNDCCLDKDVTYTYRVSAYNNTGVKVGQSGQKTI